MVHRQTATEPAAKAEGGSGTACPRPGPSQAHPAARRPSGAWLGEWSGGLPSGRDAQEEARMPFVWAMTENTL